MPSSQSGESKVSERRTGSIGIGIAPKALTISQKLILRFLSYLRI
ncbi:hypothetical protein [Paenibacillus polysaccharolyticus]|nr:hypothetical protein [Paenibacillus polysaccharolyticus]